MDKATVLQQHQVQRAAEVVELAAGAVLDLAAAATLLEKESGSGHNIYGHDNVQTGGFYEKGGPVTKENFLKYKAHRGGFGAQGVGPTQLTLPAFQDRADERGGCWDWRVNALVGFEILADLIEAHGTRGGFRRYNGSGQAAEDYADDAMTKLRVWQVRLGDDTLPDGDPEDDFSAIFNNVAEFNAAVKAAVRESVQAELVTVGDPTRQALLDLARRAVADEFDTAGSRTRTALVSLLRTHIESDTGELHHALAALLTPQA
jgi:hypothetical protein